MKYLLLIFLLSSCCHDSGVILEKTHGLNWPTSSQHISVYAYKIAIADTIWVVSDIEYEIGDTLNGKNK